MCSALDAQIADLERQMAEHIAQHEAATAALLRTMPGIGPTSAACLTANLPELGTLNRQQIGALVGVAPFANDSVIHRGRRSIRGGRFELRRVLHMAAMAAIRHATPVIAPFYERLRANGKCLKVALVACIRKMLGILNTMLKNGQDAAWDRACLQGGSCGATACTRAAAASRDASTIPIRPSASMSPRAAQPRTGTLRPLRSRPAAHAGPVPDTGI